ncbi:MAG: SUMF1/EgtB/PvdO family nonheme iron enzyme [Bacteroidales bacterium]
MAEKLSRNLVIAKRYRLSELLGSGTFTEVWKAIDQEEYDNAVVLKFFLPGRGLDEKGLNTFEKTMQLLPSPEEGRLVPFRYFTWHKLPVKVMPWYEGSDIAKQKGAVSEQEAERFLQEGALALARLEALENFRVHYDLRPDRFLMDKEGHYFLKDYEITPDIHNLLAMQSGRPNIPFGESAYKAPEQFNRALGLKQYTPKGNMFSLGAIFFEWITGELPFGELGGVAMRATTPIPELPYKWSRFQPLLNTMLAHDTTLRPQAQELPGMIQALPYSSEKRLSLGLNPKIWIAGFIVLLTFLALWFFLHRQPQKASRDVGPPATEKLSSVPQSDTAGPITDPKRADIEKGSAGAASTPLPPGALPMEWIRVEGGEFLMGNPDTTDKNNPLRRVAVSSFSIGKYEVTVAQYRAFCKATQRDMPYEPPWGFQENHPVVRVTWFDAREFAEWMGGRLPTEAEWEYAARGGAQSKAYLYSGSNQPDEVAWHPQNANARPHDVGTKKGNELGIHDMSGNVWEWCSDWYDEEPYSRDNAFVKDPTGPAFGKSRSL